MFFRADLIAFGDISLFCATIAIFDTIQLVRADVSTVALCFSASTASIILGGGAGGKQLAMPNARIMIHQPLGGAGGQAINVEIIPARKPMRNMNSVKYIDRDRYISATEAVEYGIFGGVIDRDSVIPLMPVPESEVSTSL